MTDVEIDPSPTPPPPPFPKKKKEKKRKRKGKKETLNPKNRCTSTHVVDLRMKSQVSVHVCFISIIACFANLKSSGNHLQLG